MRTIAILTALVMAGTGVAQADTVRLLAAGSLRLALTEVAEAFEASGGAPVEAEFAASGLLRDRILGGEPVDVFASANLEHPQAIAAERGGDVVPFARNTLCALTREGLDVSGDTFVDVLLREDVRVGTSTPKADPSGDYAFELFEKAEAVRPGAAEALKAKALQLTGGPDSPKPDTPRSVYGWVMEEGKADIFLTYCTNAVVAAREVAGLEVVEIPDELNVGADYGLIVLSDLPAAGNLADFIVSSHGQAILAQHGFGPPRQP
ncbi:molybdate ABC transporter substrate-binding protein [Lutibaculum baratangense]|uniref:Molybdenum-binding periplasmic protein n=1 Tax=Lutibaculum baratangense AMV1 TaxID=631454 RepID=V4RGA9_9HYPH|nr:molybdate ABC transporter substrate-binding protein [Lutibaculum baratangense]ESR25186.1 Molybdenum-binding periplasmic protein [Lutibaculum baratangense AMV1]